MTTSNANSIYGFNQDTPEQLGSSPLPFGRVENIKLTGVAYEPAKEGSENMCLAFYFEDNKGRSLRHTEWPIDVEETKSRAAKRGDDPDTAVQKRARAQGVRVKHIVTKIIPAERAVIQGVNSFEQYAKAVEQLIKPHLPAGLFRLKVIPNNKNYASLPPYTPFIEKQTDEPSELKIDPREQKEIDAAMAGGGSGGGSQELEMPDDLPGDDTEAGDLDIPDDDLPF